MRREVKSSTNGVHRADAVVRGPRADERLEVRLERVLELVHVLVPELVREHVADALWTRAGGGRTSEREGGKRNLGFRRARTTAGRSGARRVTHVHGKPLPRLRPVDELELREEEEEDAMSADGGGRRADGRGGRSTEGAKKIDRNERTNDGRDAPRR
eukprot:31152-Pelagococcus_subviridis.AAC.3